MMSAKLAEEIKKRDPFEVPEEEAFLNLWRTFATLNEPVEKLFRDYGLCATHYNILRILAGEAAQGRDGMPVLEVRERLVSRLPDITRLVDKLAAQGLVERTSVEADRRKVLLRLTPAGRRLSTRLREPLRGLHRTLLGHLSPSEVSALTRLLEKARSTASS